MHRQTPLTAGFVGYTSGGARTLIDSVNDGTLMQEMKGTMMFGEARDRVESPQNYGFTSVVMPATKGKDGQITESAEGFMSFIGGNRSFAVCGIMDDRRYRLKGLKPGDVAMFDHLQHQLHFNDDGMFMTGRTDKKLKFGLVAPPQDQQQSSAKVAATATETNGSSTGSSSQKKKGQKQRYDQDSKQYMEVTKDATTHAHDQAINYKTASHTFSAPDGAALHSDGTPKAGGPLVTILGDKLTKGAGEFTKQVSAAAPILGQHLTTKGYVDSALAAIYQILGVALPPGIIPPLPVVTPSDDNLIARLEARVAALESRINA